MNTFTQVPPGFRFHPTDEELVDYYLRRKIASRPIDLDVIKDVDLYRIEPWDLQELCRIGTEEQNEWYFFSHKDKKYPTGTRTNRATVAGFWKATGRDKAIYSKREMIGMRKTLVFYKGRAPNGQKSDWIMHEYRLETDENGISQEEGWVVCRVFKKKMPTVRKLNEHGSPFWYDDQVSFRTDMESPLHYRYSYPNSSMKEFDFQPDHFLQLPLLENPNMQQARTSLKPSQNVMNPGISLQSSSEQANQTLDQDMMIRDWRVLDKFVAFQLSQEDEENDGTSFRPGSTGLNAEDTNNVNVIMGWENNSASTSFSCQIDTWK